MPARTGGRALGDGGRRRREGSPRGLRHPCRRTPGRNQVVWLVLNRAKAMSFAAAGHHSYRAVNRVARVRQTRNGRDFSGKMTRAANSLDVANGAEWRGAACNV
jgi:hypothetical protein